MPELAPTQSSATPLVLSGVSPLERVRSFTNQPVIKRALPWFLGLAAIGGTGLAYTTLAPPPQRMLYSELGDAERASVVTSLDKAGIAYSINADTGALTVAEDDLYKARMLVASDGALAVPDPASSLDSLPLGASRTLEGERMRGARQGELEMTIKQIDGVESVRVHLAEASKSVFVRDDAPPTASVMVRMAKGRKLGDGQVSAIVNLVAGSVPGLSPDAVRVVDQHGRLLSDPRAQGSDRLELQARLEDKLRAQAISPVRFKSNSTWMRSLRRAKLMTRRA
jgi:flagellar M-ring protein FliF